MQVVLLERVGSLGTIGDVVTVKPGFARNYLLPNEKAEQIGGDVSRSMVVLEQPIKALGVHDVKIQLHAEVEVTVQVNVARSEDEAVRQAAGEDVIQSQADEDRAQAEEANAERSEIAKEMFEDGGGLGDE